MVFISVRVSPQEHSLTAPHVPRTMSSMEGAAGESRDTLDVAKLYPGVIKAINNVVASMTAEAVQVHGTKTAVATSLRRFALGIPELTEEEQKVELDEAKQDAFRMLRQDQELYKSIIVNALKEDFQRLQERSKPNLSALTQVAKRSALAMLQHVSKVQAEKKTLEYAEGRDDSRDHLDKFRARAEMKHQGEFSGYIDTAVLVSLETICNLTTKHDDGTQVELEVKDELARSQFALSAEEYQLLLDNVGSFVYYEKAKALRKRSYSDMQT